MKPTSRELVKASINHQKIDRVPISDAIWPEALEEWHKQGYPENMNPSDYFDFDISYIYMDCSPRFEQKILEEKSDNVTYEDRYGYTASYEKNKVTLDFIDHKTKDRETWEKIKSRWTFNPVEKEARVDTKSYFKHFDLYPSWQKIKKDYEKLYASEKYIILVNYGPWEALWRHRGYENLLMDLALDPEWVSEMAGAHHQMTLSVLQYCLKMGIKPDGYYSVDDLACNKGMIFSPASWREIFKPYYKELGSYLRENSIDFLLHCCGNPESIFNDLIEVGVQVVQPLQVSSGLDVTSLRKKYSNRLAFWGNIDIRKLGADDNFFENEVLPKVTLAKDGGYIYHSDHSVPSDINFKQYKEMIDGIKKINFKNSYTPDISKA